MSSVQFDWDAENVRHLKRHGVTPDEFQQIILGEPLYLEYHYCPANAPGVGGN